MNVTYFECVFAALAIQHAMRMLHLVICGLIRFYILFPPCSLNGTIFEKKVMEHKMCVFSLQILSETFLILGEELGDILS
jgi:hypothetical protein